MELKVYTRRKFLGNVTRTALALPFAQGASLAACSGREEPAAETSTSTKGILSESMVFAHPSADPYDPNNRYGFNHAPSVVLLPDGHLLAVWFSGPFEASVNQLILGSFSSDEGRTWSLPEVVQDFPRKSDFDPAFIRDGNRVWFFFSAGRWNRYPDVRDSAHEVGVQSFSTYMRYSDDSGQSWSPPVAITPQHGSRTNGIKLSTGELLLPMEDFVGHEASVLKSREGGKNWKLVGRVTSPAGADEPTIAELSSGSVLMILRTHDGNLWKSVSKDRGETWSAAEKTGLTGTPTSANLLRLRDGRLVLTHDENPRYRTPLTMRVSEDDGMTWGEPLVLAETFIPDPKDPIWSAQVTYPSVAELADGTLVVVWAAIIVSDQEQYGDILAARVRI
jgi:predicted neuraminidase